MSVIICYHQLRWSPLYYYLAVWATHPRPFEGAWPCNPRILCDWYTDFQSSNGFLYVDHKYGSLIEKFAKMDPLLVRRYSFLNVAVLVKRRKSTVDIVMIYFGCFVNKLKQITLIITRFRRIYPQVADAISLISQKNLGGRLPITSKEVWFHLLEIVYPIEICLFQSTFFE